MEANREYFRAISEFTSYEVSNVGRVRRSETGKIMKLTESAYGYLVLNLYKDGKPHRKKCTSWWPKHFQQILKISEQWTI